VQEQDRLSVADGVRGVNTEMKYAMQLHALVTATALERAAWRNREKGNSCGSPRAVLPDRGSSRRSVMRSTCQLSSTSEEGNATGGARHFKALVPKHVVLSCLGGGGNCWYEPEAGAPRWCRSGAPSCSVRLVTKRYVA
jgi:hypothetical protein